MKQCNKCLLPETHETIEFNKEGACNICNQHSIKNENIDWKQKKKDLTDLILEHKNKYDYDCIVPFSGGKDSTYTLYYLIKEYKLNPLVVRFDHGFMRPNLENNIKKLSRKLGFDMISFTPNWKIVQKLMLRSFLDKGDFCWHCHTGIFSYPMWIAIEKKIPLIFWGEKSSEYTSYFEYEDEEQVDEKRFDRYINLGITSEDMYFRLEEEFDLKRLKPYTYPPKEKLAEIKAKSVCLGSYIKWDVKKQAKIIIDELDWKGDEVENVPPEYNYEKIECYMQGVRDYIKYLKRGYSRPSHLVSLDLRNNRITKNKAKELVDLYEGKKPKSLDLFLKFVGLTEQEFYEIIKTHVISPNKINIKKGNAKLTKDFEFWNQDGEANRNESKSMYKKWNDKFKDFDF
jgi:N-acetyl sugar amidotransferase